MLGSRLISRSRHTTFFNRYDSQYLYDAVGIVAEQLGVWMPLDETPLRQIVYMAGVAIKKREADNKRAGLPKGSTP